MGEEEIGWLTGRFEDQLAFDIGFALPRAVRGSRDFSVAEL
jgi:hypothetical protein